MAELERDEPAGAQERPRFGERFLGVLFAPGRTLAAVREPEAWVGPAVLLLCGYLVYHVGVGWGTASYQISHMERLLPRGTPPPGPSAARALAWYVPVSQLAIMVLWAPGQAALSWGIRSALFYGLARMMGGEKPPWSRVAAVVGWAWTPLFLQYVLVGIAMLAFPQVFRFIAAVPDDPNVAATAAMKERWYGQLVLYVSPFVFWNLALCAVGVRELFRLPGWKAVIVVLVPAAAQLLFLTAMYLFTMNLADAFGGAAWPAPGPPPPPAGEPGS